MEVVDRRFRVMASDTQVTLVDPSPGAAEFAEYRLRLLEARWSRFLVDSDIARLNTTPEAWVHVAPETITLIETMQVAARATDGGYDPTFLHQLIEAGYGTSVDDPTLVSIAVDLPSPGLDVHDVETDRDSMSARAPTGLALDPGGIGKGLAADIVVSELLEAGTGGALVSVGGDLAAFGRAPSPEGWIVDVEDSLDIGRTLTTFVLSAGGVATSSTMSRRWRHAGRERHHVIDPRTGATAATDLAAVTVIAPAGWSAEVHATATLVAGSDDAIRLLEARGLEGIVTRRDGATTTTAGLTAETLESSR